MAVVKDFLEQPALMYIVNVHWSSALFAVVEIRSTVGNAMQMTIQPDGTTLLNPIPRDSWNPTRLDPDTSPPGYIFPPSSAMVDTYRAWAKDYAYNDDDGAPTFWVYSLFSFTYNFQKIVDGVAPNETPRDPVTVQLNTGGAGQQIHLINVRLFDHYNFQTSVYDESLPADRYRPYNAHLVYEAAGAAAPIFETQIQRANYDASFPYPSQATFDIVFNIAAKTASIEPFNT